MQVYVSPSPSALLFGRFDDFLNHNLDAEVKSKRPNQNEWPGIPSRVSKLFLQPGHELLMQNSCKTIIFFYMNDYR